MKIPSVVYHVTPYKNVSAIRSSGIQARSRSATPSLNLLTPKYSSRVYLCLDLETAQLAAEFLSSELDSQEKYIYKFACIPINFISFLRDNPSKVYKDPDLPPGSELGEGYDFGGLGGVFITKDIPSRYLLKTKIINVWEPSTNYTW